MTNISISNLDDNPGSELSESLFPNLFSSPAWIDVLKSQYNFRFLKIEVPETTDFLLFSVIRHFGFSKIVMLPFCDYIIPSVSSAKMLNSLIDHTLHEFKEMPLIMKVVLPGDIKPDDISYLLRHTAYRHVVNTDKKWSQIEGKMDNSFMRSVRTARSSDVQISFSNDKIALNTFYEIYCEQRLSKFEKLPQPFPFFEKIWENFIETGNGFVLEAKKDDTVTASMIILRYQNTLYYKFGCSRPEYLHHRPNNLLFYRLLKYAHNQSIEQVDLGLSGVSEDYEGLVRFKEYMGGIPQNIYSLRIKPPRYDGKAEKQLNTFVSSLTKKIVDRKPDIETVKSYSKILYPYFV